MGLFTELSEQPTAEFEIEEETLGGGGNWISETGVYDFVIKMAHGGQSSGGAYFITMELETEDGKTMTYTNYLTSGASKGTRPYYVCKKTGKNKPLPGYSILNAVDVIITGNPAQYPVTETKQIPLYNKEADAVIPTEAEVVMGWVGKPITGLIKMTREFKQAKNAAGVWVDTTETRDKAEVVHFVDSVTGQTRSEKMASKDAVVKPAFEAKFGSDYVYDKTKGAKAKAGASKTETAADVGDSPFGAK